MNFLKIMGVGLVFLNLTCFASIPALPPFRLPIPVPNVPVLLPDPTPIPAVVPEPPKVTGLPLNMQVVENTFGHLTLNFNWPEDVSTAMWLLGDKVFLYFDKPALITNEAIKALNTKLLKDMTVRKGDKETVFVFRKPDELKPTLTPLTKGWALDVNAPRDNDEADPITLKQDVALDILTLTPSVMGPVYQWVDPDVGVAYVVMPFKTKGYVASQHKGPLHFLPTVQGMVIQPFKKGLTYETVGDTLKIYDDKKRPLVSSKEDITKLRLVGQPDCLVFFKDFKGTIDAFKEKEQGYLKTILSPKVHQKNDARFALAKFYLSTYYFSEALSMLNLMAFEAPEILKHNEFLAYQGIAAVLDRKFDKANLIFNNPLFVNDPEIDIWRALMLLMKNHHKAGLDMLRPTLPLVKNYPLSLRHTIGFLAAKASMHLNLPGDIFLNFIDQTALTPRDKDMYALLQLAFDKNPKDKDVRLDALTKLSLSKNVQVAVEAALLILKEHKTITAADATTLDALRFMWRNDYTELKVLKTYADTLTVLKQEVKALKIRRQINDYFVNYPDHKENLAKAQALFFSVFMYSVTLSPLEKISLYNTVLELRPEGERGDHMVLRLAAYYDSLDLVPQAIDKVTQHLEKGGFKESFYTDALMMLGHLFAVSQDYDKAIDVLNKMLALPDLAPPKTKEATLLKAKLLVTKGYIPDALTLLEDESDFDVLKLKGDILWQNQMWTEVLTTFKKMIDHPNCPSDQKPRYAVSLAVALNYKGMPDDIKILRKEMMPVVKGTPFESRFDLITRPRVKGESYYQEALNELSDSKNFDTSLTDFKQKMNEPLK